MTGSLKAALCAAAAVWAMPANAALYTYTFYATGEGFLGTGGFVNGNPAGQAFSDLTLTLGIDTAVGDQRGSAAIPGGEIIEAYAGSTGFRFFHETFMSYTLFDGRGNVSFANPSGTLPFVGTPIDAAASLLSFSQRSPGRGLTFSGNINSFTVAAGGTAGQFIAAIPEPSTWALMLAGFGLTGYSLRRRRAKVGFTALA